MSRDTYGQPKRSPKQRPRREFYSDADWEATAWMYRDDEHRELSDSFLLWNLDQAMRNFDLSMAYFESLDRDEFEASLATVVASSKALKPVEDLKAWNDVEGVYVLVFDEYKQFYIGKAWDIRARIKQHWQARKPFDRLIFGSLYESVLPVDELRILDTTRIFAARSKSPYALEQRLVEAADDRFLLNRISGGQGGLRLLSLTLLRQSRRPGTAERLDTWDQYEAAREELDRVIVEGRARSTEALIGRLAAMDMQVYVNTRTNGTDAIWSRRDLIGNALRDGRLTLAEFEAFLEHMGEVVVWPKEKGSARRSDR